MVMKKTKSVFRTNVIYCGLLVLVTMREAGSIDVTNCISQWGIGLRKILGRNRL
jgi:hypothetical protein